CLGHWVSIPREGAGIAGAEPQSTRIAGSASTSQRGARSRPQRRGPRAPSPPSSSCLGLRAESCQQSTQQRCEPAQLVTMCERQPRQQCLRPGRQNDTHLAPVGPVDMAPQQALGSEPVDQPHGTVGSQVETLRQVPDSRQALPGEAANGEQGLVLLGCEAGGTCLRFAECRKTAHEIPELRESLVVRLRQSPSTAVTTCALRHAVPPYVVVRYIGGSSPRIETHSAMQNGPKDEHPAPVAHLRTGPHVAKTTDGLRDFSADHRLITLAAMALVVGTGGALAAWALLHLINLVTNFAYFGKLSSTTAAIAGNTLGAASVLIPVAGCLIIGLMARFGSEKIRGHGIPEAIEAILIGRSRIQPRVAVLKPLSSAISIGTGGPFGAEGPIIMTGGAIGSLFAQLFHMSNAERKTLLVAGAAAGMAATFGTPIAAMLLAVELLLFEWKPRSFVPVAVACVVAAAWRPFLLGAGPLFPYTGVPVMEWWGLALCAAVGVTAGLQSALMTVCLYGV